jgi:hypothetical protein
MLSLESDIKVLEDRSILGLSLSQAANKTALKIEKTINLIKRATNALNSVCHHDQMHLNYIF